MTKPQEENESRFPKLRPVDVRPIVYGGRPSLLLRDPLQLTDQVVVVPQHWGPLLMLCDGTRDSTALRAALVIQFGEYVGLEAVERLLAALDEALLLDNNHFVEARERVLTAYRQAPFRPPLLAGQSYPANPRELARLLQDYLDAVDSVRSDHSSGRGLVSPHIDYARGGPVYAHVWKCGSEMVKAADLVVLLGTDHHGNDGLTLTRQHYATPFGVLPTAQDVVEALAEVIGVETAFAGELRHRSEHSLEMAAVWLHYIRAGQPCELVPILCGSFGRFIEDVAGPEDDPVLNAVLDTLRQATAGRRVVVVAAGDLSHAGPAFGGRAQGVVERGQVRAADDELIQLMCAGDAAGFFGAIKRVGDRHNVCGLPPIYLALRLLSPVEGEAVAYDRCPADAVGASLVSVCGIVFK